jgi:hypothetical protein
MAAEVPWWSNLIAILGTAVVSVLGTVYFMKGSTASAAVAGPPGLGVLIQQILLYLPHIALMFGLLADMFTMQGVYSIPSLVGVLALPASYVLKYFWAGATDAIRYIVELISMGKSSSSTGSTGTAARPLAAMSGESGPGSRTRAQVAKLAEEAAAFTSQKGGADYDGCTVYGAQKVQSPYAAQTLVVTATVFWYYILDLIVNRGPADAAVSIGVFAVLFVGELFMIGDCTVEGATVGVSRWLKGVISMAEGLLFGGIGYSMVQSYAPERLPSALIPTTPRVSAEKLTPNADGTLSDPDSGLSYVLINGVPTLNTCSTASGSGVPALPGSCPSNSKAPAKK